jgi:hypothetical protein
MSEARASLCGGASSCSSSWRDGRGVPGAEVEEPGALGGGVPALRELCLRTLALHVHAFEAERGPSLVALDAATLQSVLDRMGSRVSGKLLRRIEEDAREGNGGRRDRDLLLALEGTYERLCRKHYALALQREREAADEGDEDSRRSWRKRFQRLERENEAKLQATDQRLRKLRKEEQRKAKSKGIVLMAEPPRIGLIAASGNVRHGYTRGRPAGPSGASRAAPATPAQRISKLAGLAKKHQLFTKAKVQR